MDLLRYVNVSVSTATKTHIHTHTHTHTHIHSQKEHRFYNVAHHWKSFIYCIWF